MAKKTAERFGSATLLADTNIVVALHQTGDLVAFVHELLRMGARPERTWFLDIPYSSHGTVRDALSRLGAFPPSNFAVPSTLRALDSYQSEQAARANFFLAHAIAGGLATGAARTIIIDDGGHAALARSTIEKQISRISHRVAIVEQTANGMNWHRRVGNIETFYVVNVAASKAKREYESPVIAATICERLRAALRPGRLRPINPNLGTLVVGYGGLGRAVVAHIDRHRRPNQRLIVKAHPEDQFFELQQGELCGVATELLLNTLGLVIGCSGKKSFHARHLPLLGETAVLANASSWNLEFPKDEWVSAAGDSSQAGIKLLRPEHVLRSENLHSSIPLEIFGRRITILNGGYPVNFNGQMSSSPPESMQLTVSLMLGGVVQAAGQDKVTGEQILDLAMEDWILGSYLRIKAAGEPVTYL